MKRRIFIAINLPEDVKNKLVACQEEWADLPVRFTKRNSLHLTIVFIGYVTDDEMFDICRTVKRIARGHRPFSINFSRICLGPPACNALPARQADASHVGWRSNVGRPGKPSYAPFSRNASNKQGKASEGKPPRLIWLEGERNEALSRLKQELEAAVFGRGVGSDDVVDGGGGDKKFLPHITLARIRQMDWKNFPRQPIINQQSLFEVAVGSVEVMESNLRRDGAEYVILESAELEQ